MPRAKRRPKKQTRIIKEDDSEDNNHNDPNPESEDFFYDDVDKFHRNREKILLEKSGFSSEEESNDEDQVEEVLGLDVESEEDEEDYSEDDVGKNEENNEDEKSSDESDIEKGIPSEKAWGRKKKIYYDADNHEEREIDSEEEETLDKEEEEEALALQRHISAHMDERDFDIEEFELTDFGSTNKQKISESAEGKQEKVIKDLSKLTKEEKLKLLAKDSPELFDLISDFEEKLTEMTNCLHPLIQMARSGKIINPLGVEYLEMKYQLIMNYLVNISFYLLLKANQSSIKNHPVIERLVQYRELLVNLKPIDTQLEEDMEHYLKIYNEENNAIVAVKQKGSKQKKLNLRKKVKFLTSEDIAKSKRGVDAKLNDAARKRRKLEDLDPLSYYEAIKEMKKKKKEEHIKGHVSSVEANYDEVEEEEMDGKRSITYQISKNKGLTPKRKKELRNPRIKHRRKFGKAKIKHKSQVLPVVKELSRYGGEVTGIRTHLTRSIKIK